MEKVVLIVEDNELNMKMFNDVLQANSYHTVQTSHGEQAIELVNTEKPDLILMDICLPGISGLEVMDLLKGDENNKDIPIVAISALSMFDDRMKIKSSGCDAYLTKPVSIEDLLGTLLKLLNQ